MISNSMTVALGAGALALGVAGSVAATRDWTPPVWKMRGGPGSAEQIPGMAPYLLPATAAACGAVALHGRGNPAAAAGVGILAAGLYGAGFTAWAVGFDRAV